MRSVVGAIFADFAQAPTGGLSQLLTRLGSRTILAHTLRRTLRIDGLSHRGLVVHPRDEQAAAAALSEAGLGDRIELVAIDDLPRPRRELLRAARKWNLGSWRGGLLGTTWFDEWLEPRAAAKVLEHWQAGAILCLEGHQPLLDPQIGVDMVARARADDFDDGLVFSQAPPGLAGVVLGRAALRDLLALDIPLGLLLSYRPEIAQPDPIIQPGCVHVREVVAQTAFRLTGDTARSRQVLQEILEHTGDDPTADEACEWVLRSESEQPGPRPVEVELELTTDDRLEHTTLRPRGRRVPPRRLLDLQAVRRLAAELARHDDRLVVLGGHGDPLLHPQFVEVCQILRESGVFGIAVVTPLVELPENVMEALFRIPLDVVEVQIDAANRETYHRVHGLDAFDVVVSNVERIEQARRSRHAPRPILVPSITRSAATLADIDAFYDGWIRQVGSALIRGYSTHGGLLAADGILQTCPPVREPCRRLNSRLMLHADGSVPLCSEDCQAGQVLGDWATDSLASIWGGERLRALRQAHANRQFESLPLCSACRAWHRS